tara:strand:+ start:2281 stop:2505 length:225 start_codon:yes stop_codon:yes gene_type:complete
MKAKAVSKEEKAYDQFYYDLLDTLQKANKDLPLPYVVYAGITIFTQLAVDFAPTEKEGKGWVRELVTKTKRETS